MCIWSTPESWLNSIFTLVTRNLGQKKRMILHNSQTKNAWNRKATAPLQQQQQHQKRFKSGVIGSVDRQKIILTSNSKSSTRLNGSVSFSYSDISNTSPNDGMQARNFLCGIAVIYGLNDRCSQYSIVIRFSASFLFENFGNFWSYSNAPDPKVANIRTNWGKSECS